MTISSSLNAGVAGLAANASRLAGIADNIANSATDGYRRVVTDFASLAVGDSPAQYVAGGVRTSSTRLIDEAGSLTSAANATDIAVSGRGFLPVTDRMPEGVADTRLQLTSTGAFRPDAEGVMRDAKGQILLAWPADAAGDFGEFPRQSVAGLEPVRIEMGFAAGAATTELNVTANLPATATAAGADPTASYDMETEYYDAMGNLEALTLTFTPNIEDANATPPVPPNTWVMTVNDSATAAAADDPNTPADETAAGALVAEFDLAFSDARSGAGTLASAPTAGANNPAAATYDPNTGMISLQVEGGPLVLGVGKVGEPGGLSQISDTFAPAASRLNGAPAGSVAAVEVLQDGTIRTISETGFVRSLYRIPLVDVPNPNGLRSETGATFTVSSDSGGFYLWDAGDGPTGTIEGFSRLESATDVAGELTDLIQTQRAYSSNAKIIQTVDEMLQETTNIKR